MIQSSSAQAKNKSNNIWDGFKSRLPLWLRIVVEVLEFLLILLLLLIIIRQGIFERRFIPSESMVPTLQIGDQLIIEKIGKNMHKLDLWPNYQRGDIIVFYPPPQATFGQDLRQDPIHQFVRLTGISGDLQLGNFRPFPFLPETADAYIKRIVGLPGETIEIKAGEGVFIDGRKLYENYTQEEALYNLKTMADIQALPENLKTNEPIVVPENHYFCLGDNRNNSKDSHVWGFVAEHRVIGRAHSIIWRDLGLNRPSFEPPWPRFMLEQR